MYQDGYKYVFFIFRLEKSEWNTAAGMLAIDKKKYQLIKTDN